MFPLYDIPIVQCSYHPYSMNMKLSHSRSQISKSEFQWKVFKTIRLTVPLQGKKNWLVEARDLEVSTLFNTGKIFVAIFALTQEILLFYNFCWLLSHLAEGKNVFSVSLGCKHQREVSCSLSLPAVWVHFKYEHILLFSFFLIPAFPVRHLYWYHTVEIETIVSLVAEFILKKWK